MLSCPCLPTWGKTQCPALPQILVITATTNSLRGNTPTEFTKRCSLCQLRTPRISNSEALQYATCFWWHPLLWGSSWVKAAEMGVGWKSRQGIWEKQDSRCPAFLLVEGRKSETFGFLALSICLSTQVIIPSLSPWLQSTFGNYIQPLCGASRKMSLREKENLWSSSGTLYPTNWKFYLCSSLGSTVTTFLPCSFHSCARRQVPQVEISSPWPLHIRNQAGDNQSFPKSGNIPFGYS